MSKKKRNKKKKEYINNKNYWNLNFIKEQIDGVFRNCIVDGLITEEDYLKNFKRIKKGKTKIEVLQEVLLDKFDLSDEDNNFEKIKLELNLKKINNIMYLVYSFIEEFMPYIFGKINQLQEDITDEFLLNRIKFKIKAAVEKYNGKWTTFVRRIKTDIYREINRYKEEKNFSELYDFDDYSERAEEKDEFDIFAENIDIIDNKWSNMVYLTPEDYCILKDEMEYLGRKFIDYKTKTFKNKKIKAKKQKIFAEEVV